MDSNGELAEAFANLWKPLFGFLPSTSLNCLVELGVPDLIHNHGKPMTLSQIVENLSITNPIKIRCLESIMDILAHSGFFTRETRGANVENLEVAYSLTLTTRLLLKDEPNTITPFVLFLMGKIVAGPWPLLSQWLKNDVPTAFETCYGMPFYDFTTKQPGFSSLFHEAMAVDSRVIVETMIYECEEAFEGVKTMVDVAGGTGTMAMTIVKTFPNIKCKVFDLPHVVAGLESNGNIEFIGGDMFEAIPHAHVAMLKYILHNWSDEKCVMILKKCKEAILSADDKGGKLMIIEMVSREGDEADYQFVRLAMDVYMTSYFNGKERNEKEWAKLFVDAGFSTYKITQMTGLTSLIEVYL